MASHLSAGTYDDESETTGESSNWRLISRTNQIPAIFGTQFGITWTFDSPAKQGRHRFKTVWEFPDVGIANPTTGKAVRRLEFDGGCNSGAECFAGWKFTDPWELVPGRWTLEIWADGARLLRQHFDVLETVQSRAASRPVSFKSGSTGRSEATLSPREMTFTAAKINASRQVIEPPVLSAPVSVRLPLIPGELYGRPTGGPVLTIPVSFGSPFALRLDDLEAKTKPHVVANSGTMRDKGLTIEPMETQFARFGTFFVVEMKERKFGDGAIQGARTSDPLMLVYFDRPCTIKGRSQEGEEESEYAVDIPNEGVHLLRVKMVSPGLRDIVLDDGKEELLFVNSDLH